MQGLAAKAAQKAVEKQVKDTVKDALPSNKGPKTRAQGKAEGCCQKCCSTVCRTDPWRQAICWVMISLIVMTLILFLGGGILAGPAKGASGSPCGVTITIPVLNQDAYVWFLTSTGIMVFIMVFVSVIYCCSILALCCGDFPRSIKICGIIGFIITGLGFAVYVAWVAMGTYFVINIRSGVEVCRNTIVYVVILYVYLVVLILMGVIVCCWKCKEVASAKKKSKSPKYQKLSKKDKSSPV